MDLVFVENEDTIVFTNLRIRDADVDFVRDMLATDDKIREIKIIDSSPNRVKFQRLIDILKNNKNIRSFICSMSDFSEDEDYEGSYESFISYINILLEGDNNISELRITMMNIGDDVHYDDDVRYGDYEEFVELLKNNKTLEILDISQNDLTFQDIKYLIDELEDNDTLQELVFQSNIPSKREKENKLKYYLAINDAYRQLKKGGEVIIENNELRELVNSLFLSFSVRNAATGKMTDIVPPELKYEIAKNFVLELKQ